MLSLPITLCFAVVALFLWWPPLIHSAVSCSGSAPCLLYILLLVGLDSHQKHSRLEIFSRLECPSALYEQRMDLLVRSCRATGCNA